MMIGDNVDASSRLEAAVEIFGFRKEDKTGDASAAHIESSDYFMS